MRPRKRDAVLSKPSISSIIAFCSSPPARPGLTLNFEKMKKMPDMDQAEVYSSILHYLQAVAATGTVDLDAVMKVMKTTPINDVFAHNGHIREDGRMVHDMYLFEVKKPPESKERWDAGLRRAYRVNRAHTFF